MIWSKNLFSESCSERPGLDPFPDPVRHFGASDNHYGFCRWFYVFHRRAHRSVEIKKSVKNLLSKNCSEHPTTYSTPFSRPCRPFLSRLAVILDFTGGAVLQAVSECLGNPVFYLGGPRLIYLPLKWDSKQKFARIEKLIWQKLIRAPILQQRMYLCYLIWGCWPRRYCLRCRWWVSAPGAAWQVFFFVFCPVLTNLALDLHVNFWMFVFPSLFF